MLYKILCSAAVSAVLAVPALAQTSSSTFTPGANAEGDSLIAEMSKAYRSNNKGRLTQLLPQARGLALEPWAAYWELKARLDEASPQEVQEFLRRYAGSYQEDRLRNDWLLLLGQRRDWDAFSAEYPNFRMNDDREVRCYALLVEHLKNPSLDVRLSDEVRKNWYAQRDADDGCTAAAERLMGSKNLTSLDVWQKARLALESNRPKAARDAVQIVAPEALAMVAELNNSPIKFLSGKYLALRTVRKEIITLALVKLAASDSEGAAFQLDGKWSLQLTAEERNWVWGLIGKQTASRMGTVPAGDALAYYARVTKDTDLTDDMLAWKARAALRAGTLPSWQLVLQAINAMSEEGRADPTWTYWKARALLATSTPDIATAVITPQGPATTMVIAPQRAEALALLRSIASVRGFYEQLALEELGLKISVPPRPAALTAEEKNAALGNPSLMRGAYAIQTGLRSEGVREWNYATNLHRNGGMTERDLLAAAQLACDRQIWDRCINTSERTTSVADFEQRFPMPFRDAVVSRSRGIALDPSYVYGLIRQESRFIMNARSGVGASGLMQVMPATARWTARKIGLDSFTPDQINDRDTNITIGTAYLKLALDDLNGSMPMAAAAYNAGPGRPRTWRNGPVLDAAIWAENIPFSETRDYVKKVLSNTTSYAAILTGQPQSLKSRLGKVGPRDAATPEPYKDLP
ncbi:lytic transglycosylase domain-containing protein [Polaromonas sp. CG_23.6]|jgi:soluble lytic murein transglycosylase|uniref:lytic transglycosylase domain-containing protein n=1 Tax=Polaromonas sp. CG_23.6 TaxID=2760709 RepID=UPI0024735B42|nr:lytic transglycosylase domain-containing protein [Polaromonas sp. CG_23.6]MDH6183712.1 soluble lytic murein transglycosylase [Polaromonas sp. CG_23.6]